MKIIFLDIDGILNHHDTKIPYGIERQCVQNLNNLIQNTKANIVLISSWRYFIIDGIMTLKGFELLLRSHGINCLNRIIGLTPPDDIIPERNDQIKLWLSATKEHIDSFVILDDCEDFPDYIDNYIKIDGYFGLTNKHVENATKILNIYD